MDIFINSKGSITITWHTAQQYFLHAIYYFMIYGVGHVVAMWHAYTLTCMQGPAERSSADHPPHPDLSQLILLSGMPVKLWEKSIL